MEILNIQEFINESNDVKPKKGDTVKIGDENWKLDSFLPSGRINLILGSKQKTITPSEYASYKKGNNKSKETNEENVLETREEQIEYILNNSNKIQEELYILTDQEIIDMYESLNIVNEETYNNAQIEIKKIIMHLKDSIKMLEKCNNNLETPGMKDSLGATLTNMDKYMSEIRQATKSATTK